MRWSPGNAQLCQRQFLQELVRTHHLQADTIVTTIPAQGAVLRNLNSPFKEPRTIRPTIKYDLEEHMPFDPDAVVVDFQILPAQTAGVTRLLVAALPQQEMAAHLALFQEAGLEPTMVDLDVFALANAAVFGSAFLPDNAVLIDHAAERTLLTMLQSGTPVFARSLPHSPSSSDVPTLANRLSKHIQHTLYACEHALQRAFVPEVLCIAGTDESAA